MPSKEDYEAVFTTLKIKLASSPAVTNDWVGYLFHHTDVHNAASILTSGRLLSRNSAQTQGQMKHDNAESSIIDGTNKDIRDYVRLYFRPRNPTFFRNEGFRSRAELAASSYSAHCPVPIALIFKAPQVLSLPGARFSDRNLAIWSNKSVLQRTLSGISNLQNLPFDAIYHSETLYSNDPRKSEIIQHRNAEVIVPDSLSLHGNLAAIRCRSDAEFETLRTLLPPKVWTTFKPISGVNSDGSLFFATHLFIERVSVSNGSLIIKIHQPLSISQEEFSAKIRIEYENSMADPLEANFALAVNRGPLLKTKPQFIDVNETSVMISIYLDEHLAYKGRHWLNADTLIAPF